MSEENWKRAFSILINAQNLQRLTHEFNETSLNCLELSPNEQGGVSGSRVDGT